jgi:tellurite methyltransferase
MKYFHNNQSENKVYNPNWNEYYNAVEGRPPRETLAKAIENFDTENQTLERFAVDLGCGEGRDTLELLRRGWRVLAIDGEEEAIKRLLARCKMNSHEMNSHLLSTQVVRFENLILPKPVDLINASFTLPFCTPEYFPNLWREIFSSLRSGGRFCGQLFGERDSWAIYTSMNHHTRTQVEALLENFKTEMLLEEDHPGKTATGTEKHWHIFHIVAQKK